MKEVSPATQQQQQGSGIAAAREKRVAAAQQRRWSRREQKLQLGSSRRGSNTDRAKKQLQGSFKQVQPWKKMTSNGWRSSRGR
ncbi:hypothetical protein CDL15_Pgr018770 [Punica granatum]|uniref:Uncharacterized protein n=1 Tax=Punica granatum TaxID=22663 RepID=A0A218VV97_PUNGR|nr:hypothetical protein CDL15_Pgr018770 [Punica granatum]